MKKLLLLINFLLGFGALATAQTRPTAGVGISQIGTAGKQDSARVQTSASQGSTNTQTGSKKKKSRRCRTKAVSHGTPDKDRTDSLKNAKTNAKFK